MKDKISVAVTGLAWMGSGIGSIESAMEKLFRIAKSEILITSYAISSSADIFLDWLENALNRGVLIRFAINKFEDQRVDVMERLLQMRQRYPHFYLYNFSGDENQDLHAKVIVADRNMAIVGSSNLSRRGLISNHELALVVVGNGANDVADALDKLISSNFIKKIDN